MAFCIYDQEVVYENLKFHISKSQEEGNTM
jgi:hypothetical protein